MAKTNFTMFDNDHLEALSKTKLRQETYRTYLVIVRKTAGYQKNDDQISLSQFQMATGLSKRNVLRALNDLINHHMIIKIKQIGCCRYSLTPVDKWLSGGGSPATPRGGSGATPGGGRNYVQGVLFTPDLGVSAAPYNIKYINNTKESEKRLCKITTDGLTKGEILRHGMKNNCFDQGEECNEDCLVYGKLNFIKINRIMNKEE
ncbi:MAG: replication protein [Nitrospirae bacterium]|nr:replication protein [Nitrospirota bacterium]